MTPATLELVTAQRRAEPLLLWLEYLMFALVVPSVIGAAISWARTRAFDDNPAAQPVNDEMLALINHHEWLKRTFAAALFLGLIALGTMNYGFGYVIAAGTAAWWFYRVIRGVAALAGGRPLPMLL